MKSGHKTIIFLATAAVGLFSCGQIITSSSDDSEASDTRPWKFVSPEQSSGDTFALAAHQSGPEPELNTTLAQMAGGGEFNASEFTDNKSPNAFETIPFSEASHARDQPPIPVATVNSPEAELTLKDAVAAESTGVQSMMPGLDMENESVSESDHQIAASPLSSMPQVTSLPSSDYSSEPDLERVTNSFATNQNNQFSQTTPPNEPSDNRFDIEPETQVATQVDEAPLPNLDSDNGFESSETFAATDSSEWRGQFKPEPGKMPVSSPARLRTDPPAMKKSPQERQRTAMNRRLPSLKASPVVEQRAREHIVYGKSLARRSAVFAARQEFVQALSLIADSHDMNSGSRDYTARLASGLRALGESDDFVAADSEQQLNMDLRSILETHSSRLIDPAHAATLSPIQAMQVYYGFASEEMAMAIGQSEVASDALHSLGKLLTTAGRFDAGGKPTDRAKAMVMHQVALSANPHNFQSANELGVLMARNGRWQQAHDLFTNSLQVRKTSETWRNLARVHEQLAASSDNPEVKDQQFHLAKLAIGEYERMVQSDTMVGTAGPMEWISPAQFNQRGAMPELQNDVATRTAQAVEPAKPEPKAKGLLRKLF